MDSERGLYRKKCGELIANTVKKSVFVMLLVCVQEDHGGVCSSTSPDYLLMCRPKVNQ